MDTMQWVFLSPHFDDVVLSCGGIIWEQLRRGAQVSIWTVCAAPAPQGDLSPFAEQLHTRWGTGVQATEQRRQEDIASCEMLGVTYQHLGLQDCIYRTGNHGSFLYASESSLTGPLHPADRQWVDVLGNHLAQHIPPSARLVSPLAFGNHVDHQLTRIAAEHLSRRLWYYADYPYVARKPAQLEELIADGWTPTKFKVSQAGLAHWQASIVAHASQISTFWSDLDEMRQAIHTYWMLQNSTSLWKAPKTGKKTPR